MAKVSHMFFCAILEKRLFASIRKKLSKLLKKVRIKIDNALAIPAIKWMNIKYHNAPIENKIIFLTSRGSFDCNAKYICKELINQGLPSELVWVVRKGNSDFQFPEQVKPVIRGSYDFYHEIATSKIIIDNSVNAAYLRYHKKNGQILIETWHGAMGIKKFTSDSNKDKKWLHKAHEEAEQTDYIISNSQLENDIYREEFWTNTPIWQYGHARNDILFASDPEKARIQTNLKERYNIDENSKLCLYAPTFRGDGSIEHYSIDYDKLSNALSRKFGGTWVILIRFHFETVKKLKHIKLPDNVIDVSKYPDIQEIAAVIDCGITDYSSWICEYMLTRKPGFIFATDISEYQEQERTFYYPLTALPFPLAENNEDLEQNILSFDNDSFVHACNIFLEHYGCVDDGHASERIVSKIKQILKD